MEASQNSSEYTRVFARVVREELTYIQGRRKALELPTVPVEQEQQRLTQALNELKESGRDPDEEAAKRDADTPRVDTRARSAAGLVGLALSGGGIRSATFNLGLLQGLVKRDILRYCDYLSTVSGGGYIDSCLSSMLGVITAAPSEGVSNLSPILNRTTEDWHTNAVTLSVTKGLGLRFFVTLRMTRPSGHKGKCTNVMWFDLAKVMFRRVLAV